jgi:hypothetical protein
MYVQRYLPHLPAAGEVVIFDRSWYNRAGVERVMGFASDEQVQGFLTLAPLFEKLMVGGNNHIILLKYWLEVDMDEQTRRIEARITDPRKQWKLTPMDLKSYSRWYDYSRARDDMFRHTDTEWAPWFVARSDDKKRVRLNIIRHILDSVPYEVVKQPKIVLPKRQKPGDYQDPRPAAQVRSGSLLITAARCAIEGGKEDGHSRLVQAPGSSHRSRAGCQRAGGMGGRESRHAHQSPPQAAAGLPQAPAAGGREHGHLPARAGAGPAPGATVFGGGLGCRSVPAGLLRRPVRHSGHPRPLATICAPCSTSTRQSTRPIWSSAWRSTNSASSAWRCTATWCSATSPRPASPSPTTGRASAAATKSRLRRAVGLEVFEYLVAHALSEIGAERIERQELQSSRSLIRARLRLLQQHGPWPRVHVWRERRRRPASRPGWRPNCWTTSGNWKR